MMRSPLHGTADTEGDMGMFEIEEDMLPASVCGNCLGENRVRYDAQSGRRLCIECEPHPLRVCVGCGGVQTGHAGRWDHPWRATR
jgi:hypothetical protein